MSGANDGGSSPPVPVPVPAVPVKPCLMAPTFVPSPDGKASMITRSSDGKLKASLDRLSSLFETYGSSIEDDVKKAYRKVRRDRDKKRKELVRNALRESRDKVVWRRRNNRVRGTSKNDSDNGGGENRSNLRAQDVHVTSGQKHFSHGGMGKDDNRLTMMSISDKLQKDVLKRKASANGHSSSPRNKKKKSRTTNNPSSSILNNVIAEEKKDDSDGLITISSDEDAKQNHKLVSNGLSASAQMTNNGAREANKSFKMSNNSSQTSIGKRQHPIGGLAPASARIANGVIEARESAKKLLSNKNDDGAPPPREVTEDGPVKAITQSKGNVQKQSALQTLTFPRLPSNNCPSVQCFFPPPLCQPCHEEGGGTDNNNSNNKKQPFATTSATVLPPPPNVSSNNHQQQPQYTLAVKTKTQQTTTKLSPLLLEGTHPPRPKSSSLIFLTSGLAVEDEPSLSYVPYFADGDNEDIYSDLFDTTERERLYEFGPKHEEEETSATVDGVLRMLTMESSEGRLLNNEELLREVMATRQEDAKEEGSTTIKDGDNIKAGKETKLLSSAKTAARSEDVKKMRLIHSVLAELADIDVVRVQERHLLWFDNDAASLDDGQTSPSWGHKPNISNNGTRGNNGSSGNNSNKKSNSPKKNSDTEVPVPYGSIMDSYRDLLCRRCFTYDCNLHGNLPKANLDLLGELAVQKERDGHWKELDNDIANINMNTNHNNMQEKDGNNHKLLTPAQKSICKRAYLIYQGDIAKISQAIGASPAAVRAFAQSKNIALSANKFLTDQILNNKSKGNRKYTSMKNYNQKWLRHIQSKVILPAFLPCDHDEPCDDRTCSCVANGFFCTKACGWSHRSPNFFRGCECKAGQCRSNSCACYAAKRECDPDLCRTCGACNDPPNAPATGTGQRCRNDNISMRRHCHLLIAESSIKEAGWGLFTKHSLKKGDFVHEYVGEIISQEEAERRGVIYDKLNMSYLFNLSSDLVVDSTRKGNKARYANHSSNPNIEPRMAHVNGDMRIGFFAKHDIDAQSELFFDYRYDDQIDNDLIFKPDHSVNFDWMNKKNNQGKKKKNT